MSGPASLRTSLDLRSCPNNRCNAILFGKAAFDAHTATCTARRESKRDSTSSLARRASPSSKSPTPPKPPTDDGIDYTAAIAICPQERLSDLEDQLFSLSPTLDEAISMAFKLRSEPKSSSSTF